MGRTELSLYIGLLLAKRKLPVTELVRQSGVARSTIYKILDCEITASIDILRRLSIPLQVHNSDLIGKLHSDYTRPVPPKKSEKYKYYDSAFVCDINYEDNSLVSTYQEFTKIWEIQNVGKETWGNFYLKNVDDPNMPGYLKPEFTQYPLPNKIESGQTIQIKIKFKAPSLPCTVISRWKIFDSEGKIVFPEKSGIWCQVVVVDV